MKTRSLGISLAGATLLAGMLVAPGTALPHGDGGGGDGGGGDHGMGPGMMGGDGGQGMGPGMMNGYGGEGMGPGMMNGHGDQGMGPGMMGGPGLGAISRLNLSQEQRAKLDAIEAGLRSKHQPILARIAEDRAKLQQLTSESQPDPQAVGSVYADMSKQRQQLLEDRVQAMNQARAMLTPAQQAQLQSWRRQWAARRGSSAGTQPLPGGPQGGSSGGQGSAGPQGNTGNLEDGGPPSTSP